MKRKVVAIPWRFVIVLIFLLPAFLVLFYRGGLPCTHDNALHYFRITAMRAAWRQGWIFSRWIPNLALGYGYPFFNFREPLPYLAGTVLYAVGMPLPAVLGLLYAGSLFLAAWGTFVLARDLLGEKAAWIAALSYSLGPYLLLDAVRRGNMPESFALALLPWLLLAFRRVILGEGRRPFVTAVLLLVALFLSHNITSLLFAPFLGVYVVILAWFHRKRKAWPWAFVAVALAVALTAWFWFPALTEQDTVQLHLSRTTRNNDFHYNFATWKEMLFTLPVPYDPSFLNPPMRILLGVVQGALALVGVGVGLARPRGREQRVLTLLLVAMALSYLWMSTPASVWLWEAFPLLAFVQFPWRLVGRALLPVSLLAGMALPEPATGKEVKASRATHLASRALFGGAVAALVIFSWPETYPPKGICPTADYPTMADVYAFEQEGWMGVDPEGSYFPVWVEQYPADTRLADTFVRGGEPARFDVTVLPEGARLLDATYRPLQATITLATPVAFQARWLGFYFPGWMVRVDNAPVPVSPEAGTGLLTFPVPKGQHEIEVYFGSIPSRRAVTVVSVVGLVIFTVVVWRWRVQPLKRERQDIHNQRDIGVLVLAVGLLVLKLLVIDRVPTLLQRSRLDGRLLPEVTTVLNRPFTNGMTLLGYDVEADVLSADGEVQIDLLWGTRTVPDAEYRTTVLLVGDDGRAWSYAGTLRPRGYEPTPPTTMWQPGQYAYDPHIVQVLPGTPPGDYRVVVGLFDKATLTPASVVGEDGNPTGPDLTLQMLQVTAPAQPPALSTLEVPTEATLQRCGSVGLWMMSADRVTAAPGEVVGLRWVWEAVEAPDAALMANLALLDASDTAIQTWSLPLSAEWWPTDRWSAGERWIGRPVIRLPGGLESGTYRLVARVSGCTMPLATVTVAVEAPQRAWQVPEDFIPLNVAFEGQVRLAGYTVTPVSDGRLHVGLAWQALAEMGSSYRVFVHLVDGEGRVIAQSDGEPAQWMRPTPGWAIGEVVAEVRELTIPTDAPSGQYVLRVGLYREDGVRLVTEHGADRVELETVQVPPY